MKVQSICRSCTAGCGIVAEVVDGRLTSVMGDVEHPLSHGYLCPKGHSIPWSHYRADRLDYPTIGDSRVTWERYFDDLGAKVLDLVAQHGPDSVGWYEGNGTAIDILGRVTMMKLFMGLGSAQQYTAASIDIAPALNVAHLVTGSPILLPEWNPEDELARVVLCIGINPCVSHGYISQFPDPVRRMKAYQRRGGRVWVIDPRATKSAALADQHLSIKPGTDHVLLGWLIRELMDANDLAEVFVADTTAEQRQRLANALAQWDLSTTAATTGLREADLLALLDDIRRAGRIGVVTGTGVTFQRHAMLTEWLRWVLLLATDSLDRAGGMWFNPGFFAPWDMRQERLESTAPAGPTTRTRPDLVRVMGELPVVAMGEEIEAGNLRALFVNGGNPVSAFPDPALTRRFLGKLDILAVADVVQTATTRIATHVAPVAAQMERADIVVRANAMVTQAVLPPAEQRRPLWWIAAQLGIRFGVDVLDGRSIDEVTELDMLGAFLAGGRSDLGDPIAAGPHGVALPRVCGYLRERVLPEGRWNILPAEMLDRLEALEPVASSRFTFINGRQLTRNCSMTLVSPDRSRDRPTVLLNPADAAELGVANGDAVRLTSEDGQLVIEVEIDASVPAGVVTVSHGWATHSVSRLTSTTRHIDPLSAQPIMTGLPVQVARVPIEDRADLDLQAI